MAINCLMEHLYFFHVHRDVFKNFTHTEKIFFSFFNYLTACGQSHRQSAREHRLFCLWPGWFFLICFLYSLKTSYIKNLINEKGMLWMTEAGYAACPSFRVRMAYMSICLTDRRMSIFGIPAQPNYKQTNLWQSHCKHALHIAFTILRNLSAGSPVPNQVRTRLTLPLDLNLFMPDLS